MDSNYVPATQSERTGLWSLAPLEKSQNSGDFYEGSHRVSHVTADQTSKPMTVPLNLYRLSTQSVARDHVQIAKANHRARP